MSLNVPIEHLSLAGNQMTKKKMKLCSSVPFFKCPRDRLYLKRKNYSFVDFFFSIWLLFTKGYLIWKCLFGAFNSSKKRTKTIQLEVS